MSRGRWRVLRALRVVLACLVLWLPARAASASFAPADAVVMIAGARGALGARSAPAASTGRARAQNGRGTRVGRSTADAHFLVQSTEAAPLPSSSGEHGARATRTVRRTPTPPLFLMHCALLR